MICRRAYGTVDLHLQFRELGVPIGDGQWGRRWRRPEPERGDGGETTYMQPGELWRCYRVLYIYFIMVFCRSVLFNEMACIVVSRLLLS
ncbi:hypothetical protein HYPSUDRAFT_599911 [Hypholoma sublateritium FD-334 SS-4]|uniref:Uncharacterized protein n=1 Tax=Hypholoma sublateritium (strain FD-334 SS-4) TaxID=945553 RepID=A0A0D2MHC9_HYPSF|nr:hypothetical protein HYPSUDRAFT_599911 [Hypholoma sublateritium FD-334 SS-4]